MSGLELLEALQTLSRARITRDDGTQHGADGLLSRKFADAWKGNSHSVDGVGGSLVAPTGQTASAKSCTRPLVGFQG